VHTMHPAAAEFDVVAALDYRKLVAQIGAPEKLVDGWFQEEGLAEPERRRKTHRGVRDLRGHRITRTILTRIAQVELVQPGRRDRCEQVTVDYVDLRGALNPIG